jgi:hypothetical protein
MNAKKKSSEIIIISNWYSNILNYPVV